MQGGFLQDVEPLLDTPATVADPASRYPEMSSTTRIGEWAAMRQRLDQRRLSFRAGGTTCPLYRGNLGFAIP